MSEPKLDEIIYEIDFKHVWRCISFDHFNVRWGIDVTLRRVDCWSKNSKITVTQLLH
jgi:hypothetical protein